METLKRVNPEGKHKMKCCKLAAGLMCLPILGCTGPGVAGQQFDRTSLAEPAASTWQSVSADIAAKDFSGAVAVVHNGKIEHSATPGYADRENQIPIDLDTKFGLASTGKLFTAVAILQLVEAGKIRLSDPVGRFLPAYGNPTIREQATIEHLLTMRSGLGDFFGPEYERSRALLTSHADYIDLFEDEPLAFEPGEGFEYSNAGYILLGRIIEIASDADYYDYVRANIFEPSDMSATGFGGEDGSDMNMAIGYMAEGLGDIAEGPEDLVGRRLVPNGENSAGRATAAGGGYSTVADFTRFDRALRNGELVSLDLLGVMFGEGFADGSRAAGMSGGAPGWSTRYRLLADGRSLIIFGNKDVPSAIEIGTLVENAIVAEP